MGHGVPVLHSWWRLTGSSQEEALASHCPPKMFPHSVLCGTSRQAGLDRMWTDKAENPFEKEKTGLPRSLMIFFIATRSRRLSNMPRLGVKSRPVEKHRGKPIGERESRLDGLSRSNEPGGPGILRLPSRT